jgi:hypothetical protein
VKLDDVRVARVSISDCKSYVFLILHVRYLVIFVKIVNITFPSTTMRGVWRVPVFRMNLLPPFSE